MDAVVMHDVNNMVFEDMPVPSPGQGELLVRVRATRVCATDVNMYRGRHPGSFLPRVLGHECAGEVAEVGKEVSGFKPGDRVAIDPVISCGKCYLCRMGKNNLCEKGGLMGREANGSFAEYTIVTPERAVRIPDYVSFDVASFAEALGSVYRGQRMTRLLGPGSSVVVLGMGSIGMLQMQLAKKTGANPVIAVTRSQWKLDLAKELGADIIVNAIDDDPVKKIAEITQNRGVDVVIEAAGVPDTIRQCYEIVRLGGEIIQYGIGPTSMSGINTYLQYFKEITIYGVRAVTGTDFSLAAKLLEEQAISIEPIITHKFPLQRTVEALELAEKPSGKVLAIVVNS